MIKQFIIVVLAFFLFSFESKKDDKYARYVNPLIGTDFQKNSKGDKAPSEHKGQTMPAVGIPNGMTNWVPQTVAGEKKCNSPYYYYHKEIQGFRASHWLNGSCTQDYGSVTIMPVSGALEIDPKKRASEFSHDKEIATPYHYSVSLDSYDIRADITGLSRSGMMRFNFQKEEDHYIIVEPNSDEGEGFINIDVEKKEISGYNPAHRIYQGWGEPAGFSGYFVVRFNDPIVEFGTWNGTVTSLKGTSATGKRTNVGAWIKLSAKSPKCVSLKVGTSFTSIENARLNLETEIGNKSFEKVRKESRDKWNKALGQIKVESQDSAKLIKFYSALYCSRLMPRVFSDVDGSYPGFSEQYITHKAKEFTYYCDFSVWDTYRALHPLLTILQPKMNGDMVRSYIVKGQTGGWLPIFPMWNNYTAAMVGDHGLSIIGDAIMKDIPGFDYEEAYQLMRKNAFMMNPDRQSYVDGKGRRGMESYLKYGYIPLEDKVSDAFHKREQVSRTLEYSYDDYVLSQVAKKMGKAADYEVLKGRAENYKHVIDPETGFARGRYADGKWIENFDPYKPASFICEGTPFHYTWYVPQDVEGLRSILGKDRFSQRLNEFFEGDHYWHGNEPGHHIPYLFAMSGEAWKTQKWVHKIIDREYFITPDGLSGNDDAGQMSSWLVFSMMGFYPVCPGSSQYILGSPSFEKTTITLEKGKQFCIEAIGLTDEAIYIQSIELNGKPYHNYYITHDDIMKGGKLTLIMGDTPQRQ